MISSGQNGTCNGGGQNGTPHRSATPAGRGRKLVPAPDSTVDPEELDDLARELATAFGERVNSYRKHANFSAEEAAKCASQYSPAQIDRILNCPPDSVSWLDLDSLAQKEPSLALERWGQIKEAAQRNPQWVSGNPRYRRERRPLRAGTLLGSPCRFDGRLEAA